MPVGSKDKDYTQGIKESYDPAIERIRVDALINDGVDALVINPNGSINSVIRDATNNYTLQINADGSINATANFSGSVSIGTPDNSGFTYSASSNQVIGGVYNDTTPTLIGGNAGAVRLTQYRAVHTNLRDSSGNEISPATSTLQTSANTKLDTIHTDLDEIDAKFATLGGYTSTGTITGAGQIVCTLDTKGRNTLGVAATGTWVGLIAVQGTVNGTDYQLIPIYDYGSRTTQLFVSTTDNATAVVGGFKTVRLIASSWTSGTATCAVNLNEGISPLPVTSAGAGQFYATVNLRDNSSNSITSTAGALDVNIKTPTTLPISAASLPLPTGAATESTLSALNAKVTAVNTGAVVVSSSALPSGASTAAKQDTGNTSLSSIDGKITAVNTGAVVVASSALPSGAATAALQTTGNSSLSTIVTGIATINSLTPAVYDYISLGYTGSNLTTVLFKVGGASGTLISTLTLAYSGSTLTSVTKT